MKALLSYTEAYFQLKYWVGMVLLCVAGITVATFLMMIAYYNIKAKIKAKKINKGAKK